MTSYDKLSIIIPVSNVLLNDNLEILSLYKKNISLILIKDNNLQFDLCSSNIKFDLEIAELDTYDILGVGYLISHVIKYIKSKTILFLDKYTLINYAHFEYFLNASLALAKGFITGITLTKEGENWRPYQPISYSSTQWENFENYTFSTSLAGGVIYHTDFIKNYQNHCNPDNLFNDILLHWYLYSHRTGPCLPKVISLYAEKQSVSNLYDYNLNKLLADLEEILKRINFNNEMLIGFYDFITHILSKNIEPQKQLTLRLDLFLLIKSFLK